MQKTVKLFYEDSHLSEFDAEVLFCGKIEKQEDYRIVLDRTAFFPEGGGQACDAGWLDGMPVKKVTEENGIIYHVCEAEFPVGARLHGKLDYEKRFDKMQNHSGEHIVSGLVHRHFGYENVGFHLGTEITMDFNGELSKEDLLRIEYLANEAVSKNIPVQTAFPDRDALAQISYRSKQELEGEIRIVTIPGYDVCACCAPHVKQTGEIGLIKLTSSQRYKGGTRVTMVCGFRALSDYNWKAAQISAASALLSAKPTEVAGAVEHMKEELSRTRGQLAVLRKQIFQDKVSRIADDASYIILFEEERNGNELRALVNLCMEKCEGVCIVFGGDERNGYQFAAGSRSTDMCSFGKEFLEAFSGRGGGKPQMIQGSVQGDRAAISDWLLHKLEKK